MENEYILSIDLGTSHIKSFLYGIENGSMFVESVSNETVYPRPGYAEQDAGAILTSVYGLIRATLKQSGVRSAVIRGLVFSGIWQSFLPVDEEGKPLCPAWIWSDGRAAAQAEEIRVRLGGEKIKERTGCSPHPMYHFARILWLKENNPRLLAETRRILSIKEYVVHALFGVYCADLSTASGSGLLDMSALGWETDILETAGGVPKLLPELVEPGRIVGGLTGEAADITGLIEGTPGIIGGADGAMAHLGSVGMSEETTSLTISTGSAVRKRISRPYVMEQNDAWCYYMAQGSWLLGGANHDAGNALDWLGCKLLITDTAEDACVSIFDRMNELAADIPAGADGLLFLPYMGGERCPECRPDASGTVLGLKYYHTSGHLIRALMEGIAFRMYSLSRMIHPAGSPAQETVVTGGVLKSPVWMQILSDVFGTNLFEPKVREATSMGNIFLALTALGYADSLEKACAGLDRIISARFVEERHSFYRKKYDQFLAAGTRAN